MASAKKKRGLGKGLGALIGGDASNLDRPAPPRQEPKAVEAEAEPAPVAEPEPAPEPEREPEAVTEVKASPEPEVAPQPARLPEPTMPDGSRLLSVDPTTLEPNPRQPRRVFKESALEELAESIGRDGVQEPVIIRDHNGVFELVSGERRVRASIMAGLERIPAICRDVSDQDMLKLGLIENIQREDLNAIELAEGYQDLIEEFGWTQEELAQEVGKKRATVANTLRLLHLPEAVRKLLSEGALSMGHARALLAIESADAQMAAARKIITQGLSVRQAEKLAAERESPSKNERPAKDPHLAEIEDRLRRSLGAKVSVRAQNNGRGKIEIEYFNLDELDRLLALLRR